MTLLGSAWRAIVLAGVLSACGDDRGPVLVDDGGLDGAVDARPIDAPDVGTRRAYVVSSLRVPTRAADAITLGLDVDLLPGDTDGGVDNQLGLLFARLRSFADLEVASSTGFAVDRGQIVLLADLFFSRDLVDSPSANLRLGRGRDPMPPPCAGPTDPVCRHQFDGQGVFARDGEPGPPLVGALLDHRFAGGPGQLDLPLAFTDGAVTWLPVERARAELVNVADASLGPGKLAGAVRIADVDGAVVPAIHAWFASIYGLECPVPRAPPDCNCLADATGAALEAAVDTDGDCALTLAETRAYLATITAPDLDLDGDGVADAFSIGVGINGVVGTFPEP